MGALADGDAVDPGVLDGVDVAVDPGDVVDPGVLDGVDVVVVAAALT